MVIFSGTAAQLGAIGNFFTFVQLYYFYLTIF